MNKDFTKLPDNLPQPEDDGAARHLLGRKIPNIILPSTKDSFLDLSNIDRKYGVLYFFPLMIRPENNLPSGWNEIPGARGCTPQNIAFSEHIETLEKLGAIPIGISSQSIYELEQLSTLRKFSQTLLSDNKLVLQKKTQYSNI